MTATAHASGTADRQGRLWGARPRDWADQESGEIERFDAVIDRVGIAPGQSVLEVGCGSGVFLRRAADRGARVFGLDASEALIEIARQRVPEAELEVGDMQFLPYEHDRFDLVAGFNSFFFADDMVAALREAGRVAKPRAPVVVQVWGRADRCDLTPMLQAVGRLRPPAPPRANPPLSAPGELERIATEAGLIPETAFSASFTMDYPDEETLARLLLSPGGVVEAIDHSGEEAVREAIVAALAPFRTSSGRYRLENEWRYLIATAP